MDLSRHALCLRCPLERARAAILCGQPPTKYGGSLASLCLRACRYERHTKHCPQCQQGMKLVQQAANAAAVAGVLLAVLAASLAVAAKTVAAPGVVVAALLAGGCAWAREKLLEFRHSQFLSSKYAWQKEGGLSLVKGDPVKVQLNAE